MPSSEAARSIRRVIRATELRRVHLAFLAFSVAEHATWLAVLFYALERGGPKEVGIVAVAQLLPSIVCTPFSSYAGDRFEPRRALALGYAVQAAAMAGTATAMWAGAPFAAYVLAALAATAISFTRPVMGSLLPVVTHSPADLVAANVVAGFIEQFGILAGPIAAGVLMAATSPATVFLAAGVLTAVACAVTAAIRDEPQRAQAPPLALGQVTGELLQGYRAVRRSATMRVFLILLTCGALLKGIGDVIFVTFADIRLDGTAGEAGILAGAYGVGGLFGAATVTGLIEGRRIERQLVAVATALAVSLFALAASTAVVPAVLGFAVLGGAESALVLTSTVSIQRVAPVGVLARVFGIVEAMQTLCIAIGSLAITVLVAAWGLGTAFTTVGFALAAVVLVGVLLVGRQDAVQPVDRAIVDRLLTEPLFEALPAPVVERLARSVERAQVAPGADVVVEGEPGDRFHLVVSGHVVVTRGEEILATLDRSRSFGELALLSEAPRSATVTAVDEVELLSLDREPFLEAVTGHSRSLTAAARAAASYR